MSVHEDTGAYVLDALAPAERTAFEAHLESCPACAREVRDFAATAALLGRAVAVEPPPELREAVLRRIRAEERPAPAPGVVRGHGRPWLRWALAASLVAVAGLGGVAVWQDRRADEARQSEHLARARAEALTGVLTAPDARLVVGRGAGGATGTVVVSRDRDRAVFVAAGMPSAPAGRSYQLWFADPAGAMRPAGLLDPARPDAPALLTGAVGAATGVGLTLEPAGGSAAPTTKPLMLLALPARGGA
ncbi:MULTISPECIES: anti-sigma factor [unclassified Streptomyces]|uniref:anti-sigma factor n=1 Tax=unclassified Streptomyces TaxID=2593676 RepID=UPI000DC79AD7|nr:MULTISPECIES: anti-sigma factor [unclassified Streptomyces]AWZ06816.1 anti-sigma factor [Streptomyces sp. ICC4]AWZ14429.1 anti-sigma factor [Streptomyces sp. ICC1]